MPHILKAFVATVALAAALAPIGPADAQELAVGTIGASSDSPFFIADKRGYFRDEGLTVKFIRFDSAAKAMAPLGTGELAVASGATSAALYNAVKRDVKLRIVADKAKNTAQHGFEALMVRKDLIDAGKVKTLADFKGLKVAISAAGNSEDFLVDYAMRKAGLTIKDIDPIYLVFPQHIAAFTNGGIDASLTVEPSISSIVKAGAAVRFLGVDELYPNFETAVVFYSEKFINERPEDAKKFMRAFLRGARDYNDALVDGRLTAPAAAEIIPILNEYSFIKNPDVYRAMTSHYVDPNGELNVASLKDAWQFFKDTKQIDGSVTVDQVVDLSFAKWAAESLGPYKKK
ncbi:MAG TPA: ABC transporter substrate-binding protein [Xanthobacteraceae bacterium]